MDSKTALIVQMRQQGKSVDDIALLMGATNQWVEDVLKHPEVRALLDEPSGDPDDSVLYSPEQIKFLIETMFPKALKVVDKALEKPGEVSAQQWKATEWVLSKAAAIQELTKEQDGAKIINQFILNDRAAGALEKLASEWTDAQWMQTLEDGLHQMPDGVE